MVGLTAQADNILSLPRIAVDYNKTIQLPLALDNTTDVVAVQFTIEVPSGVTLDPSSAALTERADGHVVSVRRMATGRYMGMIYSSKNKPLRGRSGSIMTINLTANTTIHDGAEYPLTLSGVLISNSEGMDVSSAPVSGTLMISQAADFSVQNVTCAETSASPEDILHLSWQVSNVGATATMDGWREQIYLDDTDGQSKLLTTLYASDLLTPAHTISRQADVQLPRILGIHGTAVVRIVLVPGSQSGEPTWYAANNTAFSPATLTVSRHLYLTPAEANITEASAPMLRLQLTRSGSTRQTEEFTLLSDADTRFTLPTEVVIPAGQASTYFYAQVTPNHTLDDVNQVEIRLSGEGYDEVTSLLTIEDDTKPTLTLTPSAEEIGEGEQLHFVLTAERAPVEDLTVILSCNLSKRFALPQLVLPAGSTSTEFDIEAIDDAIPDVEQSATITASAEGYAPGKYVIVLTDNDIPTLTLSLTPGAVSEGAGPQAVTATLRRTDNKQSVVTIRLNDDSNGGIYYPRQSFTMDKGVETITFNLGPVDNSLVDGEREVNITAAVYISSCGCSATGGDNGGTVTAPLTIYDNDGPTLALSTSTSTLREGHSMEVTVSRNTPTDMPLSVSLSSDHDSALTYPESVTIPVGSRTATFTIESIANDTQGDSFTAVLTATAPEHSTANAWFSVSDQTLPDARISNLTASATEVEVGSVVEFTATVVNEGVQPLPAGTDVKLYIVGETEAEKTLSLETELVPNATTNIRTKLYTSRKIGTFRYYVVVNENHSIKELSYSNNTSSHLSIHTLSPYTATVQVDKTLCQTGDNVTISGQINGHYIEGEDVEVYVRNNGYTQRFSTTIKEGGLFSYDYTPYSSQIGHFGVGACYPGEGLLTEMATFEVLGLDRKTSNSVTHEIVLGNNISGNIQYYNPSSLSLTGVSATIVSQPENWNVSVDCADNVPGGGTLSLQYSIEPQRVSPSNEWESIVLRLETAEGITKTATIYANCRNPKGQLKSSHSSIKTTMIKGQSRDFAFYVTNIGRGTTGKISLDLPAWMQSVTPMDINELAPGDTTTIILRLTPTEDMQLNVPISGQIAINCKSANGLAIPFSIEPVGTDKGTLTIDVCDENTYYAAGNPHLAGATVRVTHPTTGAFITSGTTSELGVFSAELTEGYYAVDISAEGHVNYHNVYRIDPGKEKREVINLSFEAIHFEWKVEETEIEDEYQVVTEVTFKTDVPMPVVELVLPPSVDAASLTEGESLVFTATLKNHGLIRANDVEIHMPTGFTTLQFEPLAYAAPFNLEAGQSVEVPIKLTRVATGSSTHRMANVDKEEPCVVNIYTLYYWDCGNDRKWHKYPTTLSIGTCTKEKTNLLTFEIPTFGDVICLEEDYDDDVPPSFDSSRINQQGTYSSSSAQENPNYKSEKKEKDCIPCINSIRLAMGKCGVSLIKSGVELIGGTVGLIMGIGDLAITLINSEKGNTEKISESIDFVKSLTEYIPEKNKKILASGSLGLGNFVLHLFESVHQCGGQKTNFDDIYNCYSAVSDNIKDIFDQYVDLLGGKLLKKNHRSYRAFRRVGKSLTKCLTVADNVIGCAKEFVHACDALQSMDYRRSIRKENSVNSYIDEVLLNINFAIEELQAGKELYSTMWGSTEGWYDISLLDLDLLEELDYTLSNEELLKYKPRELSDDEFTSYCDKRRRVNSEGWNTEELARLQDASNRMTEIEEYFESLGYVSASDYILEEFPKMMEQVESQSKNVCASVSLKFSQDLKMTRQAFRGTLSVFNGHESNPMQDVRVEIYAMDADGVMSTSHTMQITPNSLEGFEGELEASEGWTLDAQKTGEYVVEFLPTRFAAPEVPTPWNFGGRVTYIDPFTGAEITRELTPVTLTVNPSPELQLTYFMQRDVFGDDPTTPNVVEPSRETEFALLINNVGYGDARNVSLSTSAPQIVENEKGLLVDFLPKYSKREGKDTQLWLSESVPMQLGTIPAKSTTYAQWFFESTLMGQMADYDVSITHVTSYKNPDLTLIPEEGVKIRELIRSLDVADGAGFMTNDLPDYDNAPDHIYLSNGTDEDVHIAQATCTRLSDSQLRITMEPSTDGWNYAKVTDPFYGTMVITSIIRESDGVEMPLRNFWQTDRTLRDGKDPIAEDIIHMADCFDGTSSQSYILIMEKAELPESHLVLDEKDTDTPQINARYTHVSVARILKTDKWNTFVLPFNMTAEQIAENLGEDAEVKLLNGLQVNGSQFSMSFGPVNSIESGVPYMVRVHSDVNTIEVADRIQGIEVNTTTTPKMTVCDPNDLEENTLTFHGVFKRQQAPYGSHIINNNAFYLVNSTVNVSGYRGYITTQDNTGAMNTRAVDFFFDDTTTSLPVETTHDRDSVIYDLVGIRRRALLPGVNIVNRKKLIK